MGEEKKYGKISGLIARLRITFLRLLYKFHIRIRYLHDRTYLHGGWYKTYSDKSYTSTVHKSAFIGFIVSFAVFSLLQSFWPYLNITKPRQVIAGSNSVTWTTESHFTNNGPANSNYTGATARSQVKTADNNENVDLAGVSNKTLAVGYNSWGQTNVSGWTNITAIAAGEDHTVGLKSDGTVAAVGNNGSGQTNVSGWTNITAIAAGASHTVGLKSDGTVVAVGNNASGQTNVSGWTNITIIAAGDDHTVGLKSDGTVVAVGSNGSGQTNVSGWTNIAAVAAGRHHTVGLKSDGTVVAVGRNNEGQTDVSGWTNIAAVAAGTLYTVGLKSDGTAAAVGDNSYGQTNVSGWTNITAIAARSSHTVGLKSDGTVVAVGSNGSGQTNVSGWTNITAISGGGYHTVGLKGGKPISGGQKHFNRINGGTKAGPAIAAGYHHTVGLKSDGTIVAVGENSDGQTNVSGWTNITAISAGYHHTVGLKSDGTVVAAGDNYYGQTNVSGWTNITAISAGWRYTVGLKSDGTIVAVGENSDGQTNVSGWTNITAISAGYHHTVGLKSDGTVAAVGYNSDGQTNVSGWTNITAIAGGGYHTVGLKSDGTAVAVGNNLSGQTNVSGWTNITAIAGGSNHTVGLKPDGTAVAAGSNGDGETNVSGWTNITAIAAGYIHTVGLKSDGTVVATGNNGDGQTNVSGWALAPFLYSSPGTVSGLKINTDPNRTSNGAKAKWSSISWVGSTPANTVIKFRTRGADTEAGLAGASWSDYYTSSGSSITTTNSQWLEAELTLETTNEASTPILNDFTINYNALDAPASPKQYRSDGSTEINSANSNNYTNESTAKLKADLGVPFASGSPITPQFEVRTDINWTGTPGTPGGVTATAADITYTCAADPCDALGVKDVGTFSGLSPGNHYYWKTRTTDASGRVSAWSDAGDFLVEQNIPTGTVLINSGASYATSTSVNLALSASDTGGSGLSQMRFSNDGTTWSSWEAYSTTKAWTLTSGDGQKTVYVQFKDNAGNMSGNITLGATADTSLSEGNSNANFEGNMLYISPDSGSRWRTLVKFDLNSNVPSDATINSANLKLYEDSGNLSSDISAYKLTRIDWTENGATWLTSGAGAWTTPGGDYVTSSPSGGSAAPPGAGNWIDFSVNAIVQDAFTNTSGIASFMMLAENGSGSTYFYARTISDASLRPKLVVSYFNTDSITLDTAPPTAFSLSSPADDSWSQSATPTLSWTKSTSPDVAKYQLFIDSWVTPNRDNISANDSSTTPTSALSEGNHLWRIKAIDGADNETWSTETRNTGYDIAAPSLTLDPGFTFSASDDQNTTVTLSWNTYADDGGNRAPTDHYTIERLRYSDYQNGSHNLLSTWSLGGDGLGLGYYNFGDKADTVHSIVQSVGSNPEDVEASVKYIYRIKVTDKASNESSWLKSDTGLTADIAKPTNPSNVTATACDGTAQNCSDSQAPFKTGYEVKLAWSPANDTGTGVTGYKIYRRAETDSNTPADFTIVGYLDVDPPGSPISTIYYDNDTNNDTTFTDTINDVPNTPIKAAATGRLNDYVDYYYRVSAIDATGNQTDIVTLDPSPPYSANQTNWAYGKTKDVTSPSAPNNLTVTPMGLDQTGLTQRIDISFGASTDTRTVGRTPTGNGSGIAGYRLERAPGNIDGPTEAYAQIATTTNVVYSDTGLTEFTYFWYRLRGIDKANSENIGDAANNISVYSDVGNARTFSNTVPTVPYEVTITGKTGDPNTDTEVGHKVTVSFKGSYAKNYQIDKYEIYRATTNWSGETLVRTEDIVNIQDDRANTHTFEDSNLTGTTTYYYKVKVLDTTPGGEGGPFWSGLSAISPGTPHSGWETTPDATKPTAPQEVKVKDIHGDGENLLRNIITWQRIPESASENKRNNVVDFKEYRVYRYTQPDKSDLSLISTKTTLGDNYHVDGINSSEANKLYYYYVVAVDNAGTDFKYANGTIINTYSNISDNLAPVSINPAQAKPIIDSSYEIGGQNYKAKVAAIGVASATIEWTTDQETDSLVEYRRSGTSDKFIVGGGDRENKTNHSVNLTSLLPGTAYDYRVVSTNSLGNTVEAGYGATDTNVQTLTTQDFSISAISVTSTTTTATIRWITSIASDSAVEYKQENTAAASKTAGDPNLVTSHEVIIKALKPGTTYTYKIRSVTGDKYIADTAFATFATKPYDSSQFTIFPNATNIAEQNITATSARIVWHTAIAITSWIDYGTSSGEYSQSAGNDNFNTVHVIELVNLTPGTTYYYRVRGKDTNDVEYTSQEYSFTAILKPQVSNVSIKDVGPYSVTIAWETNVSTDTAVDFGKDETYGNRKGKPENTKNHELKMDNLEDNTTYHYRIVVRDQFGNEARTEDKSFATPLDTEGPKITEVKIDLLPMGSDDETAQAIISWTTNKPSSTKIEYDEGVVGGKYNKSSIEDKSLNNSHTVIVKELNPSATYHFRIVSRDKRDNESKSQDYTFVTPTKEKSILQLILKMLEETFSWVKNMGSFFRGLGERMRS